MGLRHHTIILVPHTRAKFRKWRISNRQLLTGVAALVVLMVASGFITWSFLTNTVAQHQLTMLAEENQQLREVNQEFEDNIRELKGRLSEFEQRTRQLAIVAGLEGSVVEPEAGVGGGDLPEERLDLLTQQLDDVETSLGEMQRRLSATPSISPVRGILTSGYGLRHDPLDSQETLHRAIDISTTPGRAIVATADGIVLKAERSGRLGNAVFIAHGFGLSTRYGHLSGFNVRAGQRVKRGDVIGYLGNTGRTTGYHLHYEVRLDGRPVNPLPYILDEAPKRS